MRKAIVAAGLLSIGAAAGFWAAQQRLGSESYSACILREGKEVGRNIQYLAGPIKAVCSERVGVKRNPLLDAWKAQHQSATVEGGE